MSDEKNILDKAMSFAADIYAAQNKIDHKAEGQELSDYDLRPEYLNFLQLIDDGALKIDIMDKKEPFEQFLPSIKDFLIKATEHSKNPNKKLNMNFLDYGIQVPDGINSEHEAIEAILPYYNSMDTRSGIDWRNAFPVTLLPAVLGAFGAILINPNLVTSKYGGRANELELRVIKSLAKILGYKDLAKVGGLSLEGGTKGNLYGYLFGLRKAFPQIQQEGLMGIKDEFKFLNSLAGHFSNFTNLAAIGVGSQSAIRIDVDHHSAIDIDNLRETLDDLFARKVIVPTILITMGTTDACSLDDIKKVHDVIEEMLEKHPGSHRPHLHADATVGWAFVFFNDYDFDLNPLAFNAAFVKKMTEMLTITKHLDLADSISIDMQKTGFTPYSSSFLIVKDQNDFRHLQWQDEDFKYFDPSNYEISPVKYSLECTRSPVGVFAASMALSTLGIEGYQTLISAGLQYANLLKHKFSSLDNVAVVNSNLGFTTLFRPYPTFFTNAAAILEKEIFDPKFQEQSNELSKYEKGFFDFWSERKKPSTPILDHVNCAAWSQYNHNEYEIPGWKAYTLNPRCGAFIDAFWQEFNALQKEYEYQLPAEYLESLKSMLE